MSSDTIKVGDFVIVQRQGYTKLHKMKTHGSLALGNFHVEMDNVLGERFFDTFQMKNFPGKKHLFTLEKVDSAPQKTINPTGKSGSDNRNITDDGNSSQNLTTEEISRLKSEQLNSNTIVEKLITNSRTFGDKTNYSQEKYIRKKEKKYFEYLQIRRPTIRLLATMFFRQDPAKTLGIRTDDLGQILLYSNVQNVGNHLLFDSGTSGLLSAAILNQIGSGTSANLIHVHPGNECQKMAVLAMGFPQEQLQRCINVNLYSVLRCFYQNRPEEVPNNPQNDLKEPQDDKKTEESELEDKSEEPLAKRSKLEVNVIKKTTPTWQLDNEKACLLLKEGVDSLIIAMKDHPVTIVTELVSFLSAGRNLVVFCSVREPLMDVYVTLKERLDFVNIKIFNSFMRDYQVMTNRTHPEVNMTIGGYILTAVKLSS